MGGEQGFSLGLWLVVMKIFHLNTAKKKKKEAG